MIAKGLAAGLDALGPLIHKGAKIGRHHGAKIRLQLAHERHQDVGSTIDSADLRLNAVDENGSNKALEMLGSRVRSVEVNQLKCFS